MSTYTAAQVISAAAQGIDLGAAAILDSASNVRADLDALESLASSGKIASISLTDTGFAVMEVTPVQLTADVLVFKDLQSSLYTVTIDGSAANISAGGMAGIGTTVELSGTSSQYTAIGLGDGSGFTLSETGTGRTSTDHFRGITELQFDNGGGSAAPTIAFVASETPTVAGAVSSAQIAALYAAVLGRTPDSAGLAFYEAAAANTANTILCLAADFISSSEYLNNPAHVYAQTMAGEMQFVTDTYSDLLNRAPEAGAANWYVTTVIEPLLKGLTAGTADYAAADVSAHALVLAYFSQSPEFRTDVQVTAAHPADAQHWLILV
ncbi:MAG TPA: DUF4214 domain-containing protein [Magnetospirillaceae bacterium]|nr:DUF4214 domain-containing protein [Magnetospirillaceae bacterium]